MMKVLFKNMDKSDFALEAVEERLGDMVEKFPRLQNSRISVTLSMENSPLQPGPDSYSVKLMIEGSEYGSIMLTKSSSSLYLALAEVRDHLLETLNRAGDRNRVIRRNKERKFRTAV